jgi:hypothetical protein
MDITVLGPQRRSTAARTAVAELIPEGPVATVNAGWREREPETEELDDVLGGRLVHLDLYRRWQLLMHADPDYAAAERRLTELLAELQEIYALRLQHEQAAIEAVFRRTKVPAAQAAAVEDAVQSLRRLDAWHLAEVAATRESFYHQTRIGERDSVAEHRRELAALIDSSAGMVVAGGHVGVLLHVLHIFGLAAMLKPPLITWSAGAMALSERVMLFHHQGPPGRRYAEVYAEGLGAYGGVVPFPHPRRRLALHDKPRMGVLARRLAPRVCLLLSDGVRVELAEGRPLPPGSRWIDPSGEAVTSPDRREAPTEAGVG